MYIFSSVILISKPFTILHHHKRCLGNNSFWVSFGNFQIWCETSLVEGITTHSASSHDNSYAALNDCSLHSVFLCVCFYHPPKWCTCCVCLGQTFWLWHPSLMNSCREPLTSAALNQNNSSTSSTLAQPLRQQPRACGIRLIGIWSSDAVRLVC